MMDPQQHHRKTADIQDFSRGANDSRARLDTSRNRTARQADTPDADLQRQNAELLASRDVLERERQKYFELFQLAPDAYFVTDNRGVITDANVAATQLLGVASEFLLGKPLLPFLDEPARKNYAHQLDRLCGTDRIDDWETSVRSRTGTSIPVSVSIGRMYGPDRKLSGYRWIVRDITGRKMAESAVRELNRELEVRVASRTTQLAAANRVKDELLISERQAREQAETANRVKSEFLAVLSHEFRTPLQAVFGYTELLEREIHGALNETQHRYVQRIQQSQQHLLGVINTVLDFAALESGRLIEVNVRPVRIDELLRLTEALVGPQLQAKDINYEYICGEAPLLAEADATKVQQIVVNLMSNAINYTDRGGRVVLECLSEDKQIAVNVRDTGPGIANDKLDLIFEPFIRIKSRGGSTNGAGLGLSISRRLARAMGGSLTAVSEIGKGSTFTLRLPLSSVPEQTVS